MNRKFPCNILIDSKGNKHCLYYKDSAIYYSVYYSMDAVKEKILINKVLKNFICTISVEDDIYVLCETLNNDILLFINKGSGWDTVELKAFANINYAFPLEMFLLKGILNIIFCSKIQVNEYYSIHHAQYKNNNWNIFSVCRLYSKEPDDFYPSFAIGESMVDMVLTDNEDDRYKIVNYLYDSVINKWLKSDIVNLYNGNISTKLLPMTDDLFLIAYYRLNKMLTFFVFKKKKESKIAFLLYDTNKIELFSDKGIIDFKLEGKEILITHIDNNKIQSRYYDMQNKYFTKISKVSHRADISSLTYVRLLNNDGNKLILKESKICNINKYLEISELEQEDESYEIFSIDDATKNKQNDKSISDKIDLLSVKIAKLDDRLFKLIENTQNNNINETTTNETKIHFIEREKPVLKESDFKKKFMRIKPTAFKMDNSMSSDNILSKDNKPDLNIDMLKEKASLQKTLPMKDNLPDSLASIEKKENKFIKMIGSLFK